MNAFSPLFYASLLCWSRTDQLRSNAGPLCSLVGRCRSPDATARTALIRPTLGWLSLVRLTYSLPVLVISGLWHQYKTGHGSTRSWDGRHDRSRQSLGDL